MNNLSNECETVSLFKLLSLDLSPCLQSKIIEVYKNYFINIKINNDYKIKVLGDLVTNHFFDILLAYILQLYNNFYLLLNILLYHKHHL